MAANVYECMFLLDSSKVAGNLDTADKQIRTILEKHNAEVLVCRLWDERKLTYQIGNQKKGIYFLTYFSSEGKNLVAIEHDCALNEMIMRQLIIKIPAKYHNLMIELAKGEHATALHNMQEEPGTEEAVGADAGADGRRKRNEPRE
jgi:small subunit ribosomal protein S6